MAIKNDYEAGTVSIAANGTVLTGVGCQWQNADIQAGDTFKVKNLDAIIASVDSQTQITLKEAWTGGALTASTYAIRYQPDGSRFTAALRTLVASLTGGSLSALQSLTGAANKIAYFTGPTTMALADFKAWAISMMGLTPAANQMAYFDTATSSALTALTAAGRALIDDATADAQLTTLGVSTFIKTLLNDADAATARATIGAQAALGYTPVQNGTGVGQNATILTKIGWDATNNRLKASVDALDLGMVWTDYTASASKASNGYCKFPDGTIIQWGSTTNAATDYSIGFPLSFPTACRSVQIINTFAVGATQFIGVSTSNIAPTFFDVRCRNILSGAVSSVGTVPVTWMAVGY